MIWYFQSELRVCTKEFLVLGPIISECYSEVSVLSRVQMTSLHLAFFLCTCKPLSLNGLSLVCLFCTVASLPVWLTPFILSFQKLPLPSLLRSFSCLIAPPLLVHCPEPTCFLPFSWFLKYPFGGVGCVTLLPIEREGERAAWPEDGLLACSLRKLRLQKEAGRRVLSVPQHPTRPLGGGRGEELGGDGNDSGLVLDSRQISKLGPSVWDAFSAHLWGQEGTPGTSS